MYRYIIEQHVGSDTWHWRLLSNDRYDERDPIRLNREVARDANGEEVWASLDDTHGTITERKAVREGGTIDGATVVKIHADTVEFEQDGKRWTQKKDEPYLAKTRTGTTVASRDDASKTNEDIDDD